MGSHTYIYSKFTIKSGSFSLDNFNKWLSDIINVIKVIEHCQRFKAGYIYPDKHIQYDLEDEDAYPGLLEELSHEFDQETYSGSISLTIKHGHIGDLLFLHCALILFLDPVYLESSMDSDDIDEIPTKYFYPSNKCLIINQNGLELPSLQKLNDLVFNAKDDQDLKKIIKEIKLVRRAVKNKLLKKE